jgi:hypothetical protein
MSKETIPSESTVFAITSFDVTQSDLSEINTETLISGFDLIDEKTQLLKGKVLLEIRKRCHLEGKTLQDLIEDLNMTSSSLLNLSKGQRNRLMNLAEFFNDKRPMNGISVTVAYEISAPRNQNIAMNLYTEAFNKNLTVDDIKILIDRLNKKDEFSSPKLEYVRNVSMSQDAKNILGYVNSMKLGRNAAIKAVKECYTKMIENVKKTPIEGSANRSA